MKVLIDIGHPAHVHLFKNFANQMIRSESVVLFTVRNKESEEYLLKYYQFNYVIIGKHFKTRIGKLLGLIVFNFNLYRVAKRFKPDVLLSHGSIYAAQVSWLLRKPHISLEDTGNDEQVNLYLPFTKTVLTSVSFKKNYGEKQIKYNGFHELAYLHPNYFTTDINFNAKLGLKGNERYVIVRFVSWEASHDTKNEGISNEVKQVLISAISKIARVFISSEGPLAKEYQFLRYPLGPETMHQALANATLFIGEGATMASECAMLGTPAIYVNSLEADTIDEQEKLGLIYHFRNSDRVILKALEILQDEETRSKHLKKREILLQNSIDLTAFIKWFIESYPESLSVMRKNPNYQERFK